MYPNVVRIYMTTNQYTRDQSIYKYSNNLTSFIQEYGLCPFSLKSSPPCYTNALVSICRLHLTFISTCVLYLEYIFWFPYPHVGIVSSLIFWQHFQVQYTLEKNPI